MRTINVAKMGEKAKTVLVEGELTYRKLLQNIGYSGAERAMVEGKGIVNPDEPVGATVTDIIIDMPKIDGGSGAPRISITINTGELEDDDDFEDEDFEEEEEDSEPEEDVPPMRIINIAKMGEKAIPVMMVGEMTYRVLLQKAGYSGAERAMVEGRGIVNPDEPVGATITDVIIDMPKIDGGFN